MEIRRGMEQAGYEQLSFWEDVHSGLRAVIVIHNTALGPAIGGCRMWSYDTEEDAIADAIRLAKGMSYKSAISGLPYGGGKAVIIRNGNRTNNEALFRSFARFINRFQGRYITGLDLGTTVADMDLIRLETGYVTDTTGSLGATGIFTAEMTAYGVFLGIQASVLEVFGSQQLTDRRIAVQGLGKVGYILCRYLHNAGAKLVVSDIDPRKIRQAVEEFGAQPVSPGLIYEQKCDVFSPCALGGIINDQTVSKLRSAIVAGSANNQLAEERHGDRLQELGILYAPDYVINAGGIIVTANELQGRDAAFTLRQVKNIFSTLIKVFKFSQTRRIAPSRAADLLTEHILAK